MNNSFVFGSVDHFLFQESIEYAVSQVTKLPELTVLPFRWNILHIVSVYANHGFIEKMPAYSQFKVPFLVDSFNHTPLHYLIAHKNVNSITVNIMFRFICDYLEDCHLKNPHEFEQIVKSVTPLFPLIFQRIETKSRHRFLRIIYAKSPAPCGLPLPTFGNFISRDAVFSDSPVLIQETRDKIWNDQGTTQVEFRSNFLHLDYDILSQDMNSMVNCLKEQESEEIFKLPVIMRLIDHLWRQAATPLMIFFALYSAFIIALSVYLTFDDRSLPFEIALLAVSVLFTVNEFWQVFHLRMSYLESLWNWLDLAHLLLTISFLITRIADDENELARAWISAIIIIFGYIRWISLLKIFKPTRNLIQVVLTILKDMVSFIIIIASIIVALSLVFLVFNREAGYGNYLYEAYNVLYGPTDIGDGAAWPFSQKLIMAVLAFFLNVVLLNLLISIMGDSYGQVLEMRDRTDALTRLEMISEAVIYKKFFKRSHQTKRGCLVYCLPLGFEEENGENPELESSIKVIKNIIQKNNNGSKKELQSLKTSNETMKEEIARMKNEMFQVKNELSHLKASNESIIASNEALFLYLKSEFSSLKAAGIIN